MKKEGIEAIETIDELGGKGPDYYQGLDAEEAKAMAIKVRELAIAIKDSDDFFRDRIKRMKKEIEELKSKTAT